MDVDEDVNFSSLQKEFIAAKNADEKYSRENDAKFRAVHQKVGSYEEFKDIVLASGLKPLDRSDIINTERQSQPWNTLYMANNKDENINTAETAKKSPLTAASAYTSVDQFSKHWKMLNKDDDKMCLLLGMSEEESLAIFKYDIPSNIFEESIGIMNNLFSGDKCKQIMNVLKSFSMSSRFKLSLNFLGQKEKTNLTDLFMKLIKFDSDVSSLQRLYHV